MKVSVREVTSQYLRDMGVEAGVRYEVVQTHSRSLKRVIFPIGTSHLCFVGGICAHLEDNSVKEWTVHED